MYPFNDTLALWPQCFSLEEEDKTASLLGLLAKIKVFVVCCQHIGFDFGCGHCFGIGSTVDLRRFCVLSLYREVGGFQKYAQERWRCIPQKAVVQPLPLSNSAHFPVQRPYTIPAQINSGTDSKAAPPSKIEDDVLATHQTLRC